VVVPHDCDGWMAAQEYDRARPSTQPRLTPMPRRPGRKFIEDLQARLPTVPGAFADLIMLAELAYWRAPMASDRKSAALSCDATPKRTFRSAPHRGSLRWSALLPAGQSHQQALAKIQLALFPVGHDQMPALQSAQPARTVPGPSRVGATPIWATAMRPCATRNCCSRTMDPPSGERESMSCSKASKHFNYRRSCKDRAWSRHPDRKRSQQVRSSAAPA
jgi:hypothetical protein